MYVNSTASTGDLVSEARLTESSSSGSDTDSTEQHQGMNHGTDDGRPSSLHPN